MRTLFLTLVLLLGCTSVQEPIAEGTTSTEKATAIEASNETTVENETIEQAMETNETRIMANPEPETFDFNKTINESYVVYFFYSPGCSACKETYPVMDGLKEEYDDIIFINYSLATGSGTEAYKQFADLNNLSRDMRLVPQVLVNGTIITDRFHIEEELGPLLQNLMEG